MSRRSACIFFVIALLLSACGTSATPAPTASAAPTAQPTTAPAAGLTFTDGLGRIVKLAGPAQRIVSTAPSNTEILFAIGAGKQVIGRDDFSDYPAEAAALPKVGGTDKYNLEQIVALKPDLVLMAEINSQEQVKSIADLGIPVFYLSNPKTLEDMVANLVIVANLTGHGKDADALIETLKKRIAVVDEKVKLAVSKPVVFYELDATDPAKPYTAGPGSFVDLLIQRAGGANLTSVARITDPYPRVSVEQVVSANPDLIILGDSTWGGITAEAVAQRPGWEKLKAVTGKQIYPFDDNIVSRPGPRLVDGLEALAKLLHPELFK